MCLFRPLNRTPKRMLINIQSLDTSYLDSFSFHRFIFLELTEDQAPLIKIFQASGKKVRSLGLVSFCLFVRYHHVTTYLQKLA